MSDTPSPPDEPPARATAIRAALSMFLAALARVVIDRLRAELPPTPTDGDSDDPA